MANYLRSSSSHSQLKKDASTIFKVNTTELAELFSNKNDKKTALANLKQQGMVDGILTSVQSNQDCGIMGDKADLRRRHIKFGKNEKPHPQKPPFFESVKDALNDRVMLLVAIFAVISIIPGMVVHPATGWIEGVFILVALIIQVIITAYNDYKKDQKFVELQNLNRDEDLPVTRGKRAQMQSISVWDLVVGDIVHLTAGDKVPADCLVISSASLKVDQPIRVVVAEDESQVQTGALEYEKNIEKDHEKDPFLTADSYVKSGVCKALVCSVGAYSTRGIKDTRYNTEDQDTELTLRLDKIGGTLKYIGLLTSIIILGVSLVIVIINKAANQDLLADEFIDRLVNCVIIALIMLIVAIPEGLPMTVTVSLAYSVLQMSKDDGVIVRDIGSVEKVGQLTDLILGKTGTMTTENMEVHSFYAQNHKVLNSRKNSFQNSKLDRQIQEKIIESIVWNSSAYIEMSENSFYIPKGQGTEVSLIKWLQDAEEPVHEMMMKKFDNDFVLANIPFSSNTKKSIIAVKHPGLVETVRVYVKGAPEIVIPTCQTHYGADAQLKDFDSSERSYLTDNILNEMTTKSLRTMAFSYADMAEQKFNDLKESTNNFSKPDDIHQLDNNTTFLALVALKDPLRADLKDTLAYAPLSGIEVRLISGDHLETAKAVAADAGILSLKEYQAPGKTFAMDAAEFRNIVGDVVEDINDANSDDGVELSVSYKLSEQEKFNAIISDLKVIGRAQPEDKQRLIAGLKGMKESGAHKSVGVVGEGINDVKAFQIADVSFALQSGTSIARNEASMVLRTNDFESVMRAIMWGRNLFMNVQRFLQFQITCNLAVLVVVIVSYCIRQETVLNAIQLIYINIIMDVLGPLALASTKPTTEIAHYQAGQGNIISPFMYRQIIGCWLGMVCIMLVVMCADRNIFNLDYSNTHSTLLNDDKMAGYTLIWNTFIFLQVFNMINCRDISPTKMHGFAGLHRNFLTWLIILILVAIQVVACFTFLGMPLFKASITTDKGGYGRHFAITVVAASAILVINALLKLIPSHWIGKKMQLDESKSIGGDSKLMSSYETQAKAKAFSKKTEAINDEVGSQATDVDLPLETDSMRADDHDNEFRRV